MTTSDGKGGEPITKCREWKLGERCSHSQLGRQCEVCQRDDEIAELRAQVEGLRERVKCEAAEVDMWRETVGHHEVDIGGFCERGCSECAARTRAWELSHATDAARLAAKGEK